jgi:hypothetical protein
MLALTINANSQKLVKEYYDWAKTKIKREYYTDAYGTCNGPYKAYSEYGGILKQGQCKNDGPIGKWIENYSDGKLHYIKIYDTPGTFDFQVIDGKIISYYENGKIIRYEKNFKDMKLDGIIKEYDEKGNIINEGRYVNGVFEPTGITKIKFDEEQEKQKQLEAEKLLKKTEEYKQLIPKADSAFLLKDYGMALKLYKMASDLLSNENYPKEKISEMLEKFHANGEFFKAHKKEQIDSITKDFTNLRTGFKIKSIQEYNQYTYRYEDKKPKKFSSNYYECDCVNPWNEKDYSIVLKCFDLNKELYESYQMVITKNYFKFIEDVNNEEKALEKSSVNYFEFNNTRHSFYTYDKELFIKNINDSKMSYNKAKIMMEAALKFENNIINIKKLNSENKKKILFKKYKIILNEFQNKYNSNQSRSIDEYLIILNDANSFLEKIISLYSVDTKDLEKKIKNTDSIDEIKSIILFE